MRLCRIYETHLRISEIFLSLVIWIRFISSIHYSSRFSTVTYYLYIFKIIQMSWLLAWNLLIYIVYLFHSTESSNHRINRTNHSFSSFHVLLCPFKLRVGAPIIWTYPCPLPFSSFLADFSLFFPWFVRCNLPNLSQVFHFVFYPLL